MSSAGRPPKTTEELELQGTYREDRHSTRMTVEVALSETPPDWLTNEEKAVWGKWHEVLQRNGILRETDEVSLGLLCKLYIRVRLLSEEFKDANSYLIDHITTNGELIRKVNPAYTVLVESEKNLLRMLTEFGMTPVSRSKVHSAIKSEETDPFQEMLGMD